jgi:hypothetical protein
LIRAFSVLPILLGYQVTSQVSGPIPTEIDVSPAPAVALEVPPREKEYALPPSEPEATAVPPIAKADPMPPFELDALTTLPKPRAPA